MAMIACPGCQEELNVPEGGRGKKLQCPACEEIFRVPGEKATARRIEEEADATKPKKKKKKSKYDSTKDRPLAFMVCFFGTLMMLGLCFAIRNGMFSGGGPSGPNIAKAWEHWEKNRELRAKYIRSTPLNCVIIVFENGEETVQVYRLDKAQEFGKMLSSILPEKQGGQGGGGISFGDGYYYYLLSVRNEFEFDVQEAADKIKFGKVTKVSSSKRTIYVTFDPESIGLDKELVKKNADAERKKMDDMKNEMEERAKRAADPKAFEEAQRKAKEEIAKKEAADPYSYLDLIKTAKNDGDRKAIYDRLYILEPRDDRREEVLEYVIERDAFYIDDTAVDLVQRWEKPERLSATFLRMYKMKRTFLGGAHKKLVLGLGKAKNEEALDIFIEKLSQDPFGNGDFVQAIAEYGESVEDKILEKVYPRVRGGTRTHRGIFEVLKRIGTNKSIPKLQECAKELSMRREAEAAIDEIRKREKK